MDTETTQTVEAPVETEPEIYEVGQIRWMGRDIVEIIELRARALVYVAGDRYQGQVAQNHLGPVLTEEELEAAQVYDAQELEAPDDGDPPDAAALLAEERSRALEEAGPEKDADEDEPAAPVPAKAPPVALVQASTPARIPARSGGANVTVSAPAKHAERGVVDNPTSGGRPAVSNTPKHLSGRARVSVSTPAQRSDDNTAAVATEPAERPDD